MENVLGGDLEKFLQAVGDPFQFTPDPPLQDGQLADAADYDPMMVVVILIEFALSRTSSPAVRPRLRKRAGNPFSDAW